MYKIQRILDAYFVTRSADSIDEQSLNWIKDSQFWKEFIKTQLNKDDVIIDLGSHIGGFAILAAMQSNCKVFAFEPDLDSFNICKANVYLNRLNKVIYCLNFAAGGQDGKVELMESTENWGHTILKETQSQNQMTGKKRKVRCLSLKSVIDLVEKTGQPNWKRGLLSVIRVIGFRSSFSCAYMSAFASDFSLWASA